MFTKSADILFYDAGMRETQLRSEERRSWITKDEALFLIFIQMLLLNKWGHAFVYLVAVFERKNKRAYGEDDKEWFVW